MLSWRKYRFNPPKARANFGLCTSWQRRLIGRWRPVHLIGEGVDCVLRGGVLSDPSLVARRLAQMPYMTCATPDYLKRHGTPATPADAFVDWTGEVVAAYGSVRQR